MQQNELAKLLGISPAMVSKLKKKGMPTDDPGRAQRWRKRHLEPGRVKGSRFDPTQPNNATTPATPAPAAVTPGESLAEVEAAGVELDKALIDGDQARLNAMIQQTRQLLRILPDDAEPRLSLRVWVTLCDYVLMLDGVLERATNPAELLTPIQFCGRWQPDQTIYALQNHHTLCHACDWHDYALNGWPAYPEDDNLDSVATEA